MPVYLCDNGKFRIGEGECMYDNREHAVNAYIGYLANEGKKAVNLNKISFDFDDTLTIALYRARAKQLIERGKTVYIITRRQENFNPEQVYNVADEIEIPHSRVYFTNGEMKWKTIKNLNIAIHYDNNPDEIKLIEENTECKTYLVKSKNLMKSIYTTKFISSEIKDIDAKQGVVAGYFANFNTLDSDGDIIRKGAFAQSIQEWYPKGRVKHLLNHDVSKPLGKIIDLFEDDYGLFYKSEIGKHQLGQDFIKMAESGLVTEHSIGFRTLNEKSTDLGHEITHVQLYEGSSLTGWGANPNTPLVSIKSLSNETIAERLKSFEQFIRKTTVSDETIELCLIHIKQLYAQLNESGKLAEAVDLPEVKAEIDNSNLILEINKTFKQWQTKF
jgi:HK97 family phage prohead protease